MTDFAEYAPSTHPTGSDESVETRSAVPTDVDALAAVMAARGGSAEEHVAAARSLIERLDVLLIAEKEGLAVGWCGIQKFAKEEPIFSVINARNFASIDLHHEVGFVEVGRSAIFAGIEFTGGEGVLLRHL